MSLPLISMYVASRQVSKHVHIVTAHGWKIQMYMISWLSQYKMNFGTMCIMCSFIKSIEVVWRNLRSRTSEYLFWDFILIYFYGWPMATAKMPVWIANFSKTYVYVGLTVKHRIICLCHILRNNTNAVRWVITSQETCDSTAHGVWNLWNNWEICSADHTLSPSLYHDFNSETISGTFHNEKTQEVGAC